MPETPRPRRPGVIRPPMKYAYIGNFLDKGRRPKRKLKTNADVTKYLRERALKDLGGEPITGPDPVTDEKLAHMMAVEAASAFRRHGSGDNRNSANWYTESIKRAIEIVAMLQPEIFDDEAARAMGRARFGSSEDARTVLFAAMAITSQSISVAENARYALAQYRHWIDEGAFRPIPYGARGPSVKANLERFNHMTEILGSIEAVRKFFATPYTMKDLREAAAEAGLTVGGRELQDEIVYGSMVLGPKIGNGFYQNLNSNFNTLTIDLWFSRTWGRLTGTLVKEEVSTAQIERLASALARAGEDAPIIGRRRVDPEILPQLDSDELLNISKQLTPAWEKIRRQLKAEGLDNAAISAHKAALDWPGAAHTITQALAGSVDQPGGGASRRWMRQVVDRCLQILNGHGLSLTRASLQALLWYPEQALYDALANRKPGSLSVSYHDAFEAIARKEGLTDADFQRAAEPGHNDGRLGRSVPSGVGPGEPGTVLEIRESAGEQDPGADGRSAGLNALKTMSPEALAIASRERLGPAAPLR